MEEKDSGSVGVSAVVTGTQRGRFKFLHGQMGFTLIEVLVGVAIIAAIGVGVANAIDTNSRAIRTFDEKVQATNLVTSYLEGIRQLPYSDDTNAYASVSQGIVKPFQYIVTMNITYSPDGIYWAPNSNGGAYKLQKITISVSREGGKPILSTCTFRTTRVTE